MERAKEQRDGRDDSWGGDQLLGESTGGLGGGERGGGA